MGNIEKTYSSESAGGRTIDIARFITDDIEDSVAGILQYLDEAERRKKGEAPVLAQRPDFSVQVKI